MLLYEKKIGYLSLYQNKERKSSAGFVRISRERNACRLEIHIKKSIEVRSGSYELMLILPDREQSWGYITIRKEEDYTERLLPMQRDMFCSEGECIREEDVCGIAVRLENGRWLSGFWKEAGKRTGRRERFQGEKRESAGRTERFQGEKRESAGRTERFQGEKRESAGRTEHFQEEKRESAGKAEDTQSEWKEAGREADWTETAGRNPANQDLHAAGVYLPEDKWVQLQKDYKIIHPFGDDRVFISIELRDFSLLKPAYQRLANNSFLLHGFYNYRHLLLGPDRELGGSEGFCFYLGVPGTYFEREKMVAVMFGFEGFECSGAVETGKFGYYMRRVEIEK